MLAVHHEGLQPVGMEPVGQRRQWLETSLPRSQPRHAANGGQVQHAPALHHDRLRQFVGFHQTAAPIEQGHGRPAMRIPAAHDLLQQPIAALQLIQPHPALDAAGSGDSQGQTLRAVAARQAGHIHHTHNAAIQRMPDHRRRAGPALDAFAKMFGRMNLHGLSHGQCSPDGVGATQLLAPVHSGHQVNGLRLVLGAPVALGIENGTGGIRQQHQRAGFRQDFARLRHDGRACFEHVPPVGSQRNKVVARDRRGATEAARIHIGLAAALPGHVDQTAQAPAASRIPAYKGFPGAPHHRLMPRICQQLFELDHHLFSPPASDLDATSCCQGCPGADTRIDNESPDRRFFSEQTDSSMQTFPYLTRVWRYFTAMTHALGVRFSYASRKNRPNFGRQEENDGDGQARAGNGRFTHSL